MCLFEVQICKGELEYLKEKTPKRIHQASGYPKIYRLANRVEQQQADWLLANSAAF